MSVMFQGLTRMAPAPNDWAAPESKRTEQVRGQRVKKPVQAGDLRAGGASSESRAWQLKASVRKRMNALQIFKAMRIWGLHVLPCGLSMGTP